jgi:hypothetical protein
MIGGMIMVFENYKEKQKWAKRVFKERGYFSWISTEGNTPKDKKMKTKGKTYIKPKTNNSIKK